ncbi:hypothetical protein CHU32_17480 [Superficieibacter electus]|uniref:Uncharacterized protein n=1 Tax=Superficieibacter electus TaxID=2022662 RepID=A0A2P5GLT9_9ENTR|nr:hypothetical protein CHU33_17380 [Superficieibacter electus]POP46512.1 hypothetical protein CHU32_17480 [Superficieibacter electus]
MHQKNYLYTRRLSSCRCVGCAPSPESLTRVSSSGFAHLPPSCNSKSIAYKGYTFPVFLAVVAPRPEQWHKNHHNFPPLALQSTAVTILISEEYCS